MGDNCAVCYSKGKVGKSLWGCSKCNFLVCSKCSNVTKNVRLCSRCRDRLEKEAAIPRTQAGCNVTGISYDDLPEAFLRRLNPQQPTPSFVDHHVLQSVPAAPSCSAACTINSDKAAVEEIERRLRRLQGSEIPSQPLPGPKCGMCNAAAVFRCPECLNLAGTGVQELYCNRCLTITHANNATFADFFFSKMTIEETKIIYYFDEEPTPYLVKLPLSPDKVTLLDFKIALNRPGFKYFFKSVDDDLGVVKEEISSDSALLPHINGKAVCWLVPSDEMLQRVSESVASNNGGIAPGNSVGSSASVAMQQQQQQQPPMGSRRYQHQPMPQAVRRYQPPPANTMTTTDAESTLFDGESEDDRYSLTTETTARSASHHRMAAQRRRWQRQQRRGPVSRASSVTSITDSSTSLNIVTVTLNLDNRSFLGISVVGQTSPDGADGGIYVGSVMKGGAVAEDGRIEPGDMILEVNGILFEELSNDEAVRVLREAVQKPGLISLVVAKAWDRYPRGYVASLPCPRDEPVQPIDPAAWAEHSAQIQAAAAAGSLSDIDSRLHGAQSMSTVAGTITTLTSGSLSKNDGVFDESLIAPSSAIGMPLSIGMDMLQIVKAMAAPDSGLDVRDRKWLKMSIPNAFVGSDLVDWLYLRVAGFHDKRDAKKYASQLLASRYIIHVAKERSFREECYYVFSDLAYGQWL